MEAIYVCFFWCPWSPEEVVLDQGMQEGIFIYVFFFLLPYEHFSLLKGVNNAFSNSFGISGLFKNLSFNKDTVFSHYRM